MAELPAGGGALNVPAGVVDGDLLIMSNVSGGLGSADTLPAGWTGLGGIHQAYNVPADLPVTVRFGYRVAASEPASYTIPANGVGNSDYVAVMLAFANVALIDAWAAQDNVDNPMRAPSITGAKDNDLLVWVCGCRAVSNTSPSVPVGMNNVGQIGAANKAACTKAAWLPWDSSAGVPTGTRDGTMPNSNRPGVGLALLLAGPSAGGWPGGSGRWTVGKIGLR